MVAGSTRGCIRSEWTTNILKHRSIVQKARVQNVCACARSLFSNWRLRMRTSQQECLFLSLNRILLASKTSKQETLNLQVCTGARISRKFAAIVQESRLFRQTRASPFSVFMFDFRMKRKGAWTFKHDFRLWCKEESMWCKREKLKQLINFVFVKF